MTKLTFLKITFALGILFPALIADVQALEVVEKIRYKLNDYSEKTLKHWGAILRDPNAKFLTNFKECDDMKSFTVVKQLGKDKDGVVFQMKKGDNYYVYKKSNEKKSLKNILQEMRMMSLIDGVSYAPKMFCVEKDKPGFMMHFLDAKTLRKVNIRDLELTTVFQNMADIYIDLHKRNILHLGSSLDNWMYDTKSKNIYIIDFGNARDLTGKEDIKRNQYVPEDTNDYSAKTDVYMAGITWAEMVDRLQINAPDMWVEELIELLSSPYENMLKDMTAEKPSKRPTFDEIKTNYITKLDGSPFKDPPKKKGSSVVGWIKRMLKRPRFWFS